MHFPANAGLIFLNDELTNDRYLVDTGATLSIVPCNQNSSPSGPLLKGADGQPIPSWGFIQKIVQFQGKLFTSTFLQATVAGPILGIDFLRKFKFTVSPKLSQIQFACSAAALPAHILPPAAPPALYCSSSFNSRENKSLSDPPSLFQKIPDSVPDDVKNSFAKISLRHLTMGSSITSTPVATPPFLQNPAASIQKNCKSPRQNSKG
jgi:hypothetical protein